MRDWTRRDLLKTGISTTAALAGSARAFAQSPDAGNSPNEPGQFLRERLLLDFGWRFHLGHADDPARDFEFGANGETFAKSGAFAPPCRTNFDDSAWQKIDLPHDWAVELPFENARPLTSHGSKPLGRSWPATSIGWYRRVFSVPATDAGRRIALEFDGVFRDSVVVLNGHYLGRNLSGYAPFRYDVSDFLTYGGQNCLVVRVDATLNEGWFYEGAGIYRHVWLTKTAPLHIAHQGTYVRSEVENGSAAIFIVSEIENDSDSAMPCRLISSILDERGNAEAEARSDEVTVPAWGLWRFEQRANVRDTHLWSIEQPYLYRLISTLESGGPLDRLETPFGVRTLRFDAAEGFFLNGKHVKIKGTCNHQDHAGLGSALPDRVQYFRIERLKEMGSNAYRTSHNPPTPELLDACDRLGILVMDETRMESSSLEGLSQLERMVRRDRNHPSVVIWSLANEEGYDQGNERGARILTTMKRLVHELDPSRPVTTAMNGGWGGGFTTVEDVQGFNYHDGEIDAFHQKFPRMPSVGTETASTVSTRGIYSNDKEKGYVSAYDLNFPPWASTAESWWKLYDARPFLEGGFAWTGFDYRGEPTPYGWPCIGSHFGIMDTCGFPKDNFFYYQAWWGSKPVLHLFPHWNWAGREGQEIDVWCHSNLDRVELFVNGQSAGAKNVERNSHVSWKVRYVPGVIEARGFQGGREALRVKRETTGAPAAILLHPDRLNISANGEDVSMIAVEVVDDRGRMVPTADDLITFTVSGAGRLIGVGNGDPSSHEPDKASQRRVFNGLCMAIIQAGKQAGTITATATASGLKSVTATITCDPATLRPAVS